MISVKPFVLTVLIMGFLPVCLGKTWGEPEGVYGQESWQTEFQDLASKAENVTALTRDELRSLIERCDRLKAVVETLDESPRKVYLKRLQMCRDLFVYVLQLKEHE